MTSDSSNTPAPRRVAITGATGLIGRALTAELQQRGFKVVPVVRAGGSAPADGGDTGGDIVRWDPLAATIDTAALDGLHAVVHLAGEPIAARRWSAAQKQRIADSRIVATGLLAESLASLDRPPAVLISASAIGWYGDRGSEILHESSQPGEGFLADVCAQWEAAADPARAAGIRVCHPRTGIVLSTTGGALASLLTPFKLGIGGRVGNGRQYMSWITLADEVAALVWLLESDIEGPVNLTAPNPVTNAEFTKTLGEVLRRPTLLPTPKPALWARLGRELAQELLYSSARVQPSVLSDNGFEFSDPQLRGALESLLRK